MAIVHDGKLLSSVWTAFIWTALGEHQTIVKPSYYCQIIKLRCGVTRVLRRLRVVSRRLRVGKETGVRSDSRGFCLNRRVKWTFIR